MEPIFVSLGLFFTLYIGHYFVTFFSHLGTSPTMTEWTGMKEMFSVTKTNLELYLYDGILL